MITDKPTTGGAKNSAFVGERSFFVIAGFVIAGFVIARHEAIQKIGASIAF